MGPSTIPRAGVAEGFGHSDESELMTPETSSGSMLESSIATPFGTAPRCQAKNRRRDQCARPARRGYRVCSMHGAGTRKREQAGTRQNPRTAPITTGLTAQPAILEAWIRAHRGGQARLDDYRRNPQKLRNWDEILARQWALADLIGQRNPIAMLPHLTGLARSIERAERIASEIRKSAPGLTRREAEDLVGGLVEILHEFVPFERLDEAIRRTRQLAARVVGSPESPPSSPGSVSSSARE
jgi:hypothetical protein